MKKMLIVVLFFVCSYCFSQQPPLPLLDTQNPCREANGLKWDLREQLNYYKTHIDMYGSSYLLTDGEYIKTEDTAPTLYRIKKTDNEVWSETNLVSKIAWFRLSGWVSRIVLTNDIRLLRIDCWDDIKQRKVPTYCLLHPEASHFIVGDYVDCLVYYCADPQQPTYSFNGMTYQFVQYGNPDYINEGTLTPFPSRPSQPIPMVPVPTETRIVNDSTRPLNGNDIVFTTSQLYDNFSVSLKFIMDDYDNAWPTLILGDNGAFGIGIIGKTSGTDHPSGIGTLCSTSENDGQERSFNWFLSTSKKVTLGALHSIVFIKNGNRITLYLDRELIGEAEILHMDYKPLQQIHIGKGKGDDSYFHGKIFDVKIHTLSHP